MKKQTIKEKDLKNYKLTIYRNNYNYPYLVPCVDNNTSKHVFLSRILFKKLEKLGKIQKIGNGSEYRAQCLRDNGEGAYASFGDTYALI